MEYVIGTTFTPRSDRDTVYTVTDILKTYNNAGKLVRTHYECTHQFCGQSVKSEECETTIAMGNPSIPYKVLKQSGNQELRRDNEGRLYVTDGWLTNWITIYSFNGEWSCDGVLNINKPIKTKLNGLALAAYRGQ